MLHRPSTTGALLPFSPDSVKPKAGIWNIFLMTNSVFALSPALASPQANRRSPNLPLRLSDYLTCHASAPGSSVIADAKSEPVAETSLDASMAYAKSSRSEEQQQEYDHGLTQQRCHVCMYVSYPMLRRGANVPAARLCRQRPVNRKLIGRRAFETEDLRF